MIVFYVEKHKVLHAVMRLCRFNQQVFTYTTKISGELTTLYRRL